VEERKMAAIVERMGEAASYFQQQPFFTQQTRSIYPTPNSP